MVANPKFESSEIPPERNVVYEEYRRSFDNPGQFAFQQLQKKFFRNGYDHPILGRPESIKKFTRKQLTSFRKNHYNIANSLLIVAGNLKNYKSLPRFIEDFKFPIGIKSKFPPFQLHPKAKSQIHQKDVKTSQLNLVIEAPHYQSIEGGSEDLAINCLGHGESSPLYKGLVLNSAITNSSSSSTLFMAKGGVHFIKLTFPHKNFEKVLKTFIEIISKYIMEGFEEKEIKKIKNQYLSSKIYDKETLESYAFSFGHSFAQNGDIYSEEKFIEQIKKIQIQEVNLSFQKIFNRPIHTSLQIPLDESKQNAEKILKKFQKDLLNLKKIKEVSKDGLNLKKVTLSKYDPFVKLVEIKKGIKLIYRQNSVHPTFVFQAFIKGGLSEELPKNNGLYNILSGLLASGYDDLTDSILKEVFEDRSSSFSSFSGKNSYGLTLHGQSKDFKELTSHFIGSFLRPNFPEKLLKHEQEMILRALDNQEKDPVQQCFLKLNQMLFKKHPYAMNILGSNLSIKSITTAQLKKTHKNNLKKKEILFTYCGKSEINEILNFLKTNLEEFDQREKNKITPFQIEPIYGKKIFIPFDREQTQIFLGIPSGNLGSKDNIFFKMLTTHLYGQSSDLFVEVRDKLGLCYSIQPVHFTALEGGYWGIYLASGHDKALKAIKTVKKLLQKLKSKGIQKKEFQRIKTMIEGQNLINIQTNEDYANIYSIPSLYEKGLDFFYKNNENIKNLTYEKFQTNLDKIISKDLNIIAVGRENKEIKEFLSF
jgi:zinc protease